MNFLNKEKNDARWLTIVLGIILALTYAFSNLHDSEMLIRGMAPMMGMEINTTYYVLAVIMATGLSYLLFILFVNMSYSIAYRTLVNITRDVKAMPIAKECFVNHVQFVMIFANLIIGGVSLALSQNLIIAPVVGLIVKMLIKGISYAIVLLLLMRIGVGENVKKKLLGGFLTPLALMTVFMI